MKSIVTLLILCLSIFITDMCFAQLIADAGNDTAYCAPDWQNVTIGGHPSVLNGTPPYSYAWSTKYSYAGLTFTASFMLNDTTIANPVFKSLFKDSAVFYLTVKDNTDSMAFDSVKVRFSEFVVCLGECRNYIQLGDSVKLWHCVSGGIPPYQYSWIPEGSLSDPNSETPWAKPLSNTTYELLITDAIGCKIQSNCMVFINPSNIKVLDSDDCHINIYPDPTVDKIYVSINSPEYVNSTFEIFNSEGKLIKQISIKESMITVEVLDIPPGIYVYHWRSINETREAGKFVIK
jgi:hypothetical protein